MKTLILLAALSTNVYAQELIITDAKIKVLPSPVTAIYLKIENKSNDDLTFQKVESDLSKNFELHEMKTENGKMEMREVSSITLPKKSKTELKPGGLHIMVFDLQKKLEVNQKYKLDLTISGKKYSVEALGFEP